MSIILEALKRAEGERRSLRGYERFRYVLARSRPGVARGWRWAALAGAVLLGLGLGGLSAQAPWRPKERGPGEGGGAHATETARPALPKELSAPPPSAMRPSAPSALAPEKPRIARPTPAPTPLAPPPTRAPKAPPVAAPSPQRTERPPARPETSPRTPEGWIARARAFEREGQWARAQAAYERALGAGGGGLASADARLGLAALAERQGRGRDALAHYLAAIRMRPDDARAHARLGRLYAARGSHHLAINEYRLAIRLAPQDPRPAYSLSVLYARLGRPEYALRYLKEAIARDAGVRERARRESAFAPLRREPAFQSLTEPGRGGGEP